MIKITEKQKINFRGILILILLSVFLSGCDESVSDLDYGAGTPVLNAFLETGKSVESIRVDRVGKFDYYYNRDNWGISNADIKIFPVFDNNGEDVDSSGNALYFIDSSETAGIYYPLNPATLIPQGNWTYRIEVDHPNFDEVIWAETTMPGIFNLETENYPSLTNLQHDTLVFTRQDDPIRINWDESEGCGGFLYLNTCIEEENIFIPVDPDWDPEDDDEGKEYDRYYWSLNPETQRTMRLPWISYKWVGRYKTNFMAVSPEYYEYIKSIMNNEDSNEQLPIISNVHAGLGIFGGLSNHSFNLIMTRVE